MTVLAFVVLSACNKVQPPPPQSAVERPSVDAGSEDQGVSSGTDEQSLDGGPVPLKAVATAVVDTERRALVAETLNESIPPGARFEVEMPRLADVRVRLFDANDRAVESNDTMEIGDATRYSLQPAEPLVPGSKYSLLVDGLQSEMPKDHEGREYDLVRWELKTAGEKPAPAPKTKAKGSKRRRGRRP